MLGLLPRMNVLHTSAQQQGQVYVPVINWLLMLAAIGLVLGFGSSSRLAAAYGIAVTLSMLITTLLAFTVVRSWGWSIWQAAAVTGLFLAIEGTFLSANLEKIVHGGWFPLLLAAALSLLMTTWNRGRLLLAERFRKELLPLTKFFQRVETHPPLRVPGTAVFMTGQLQGTPPALLHNVLPRARAPDRGRARHRPTLANRAVFVPDPQLPAGDTLLQHTAGSGDGDWNSNRALKGSLFQPSRCRSHGRRALPNDRLEPPGPSCGRPDLLLRGRAAPARYQRRPPHLGQPTHPGDP
jgi:hypothetical protein